MTPLLRLVLVGVFTLTGCALLACRADERSRRSPDRPDQPSRERPTDGEQPTPVDDAPSRANPIVHTTGGVSEAEFKALHELAATTNVALLGEEIQVGGAKAYLSLPVGAEAPLPGVVLIHEWWGLNEHVKRYADRVAALGYATIAVDLYGGVVAQDANKAYETMLAVDPKKALDVMLAAHRFLAEDARVRATKRGSIGWCFGGTQALNLALAAQDLDAVVMYYGTPVTDPVALSPLHAQLLGIFGTRDKLIPPEKVAQFEEGLKKAGKQARIVSYDAEHAFANLSNPRYDMEAAAQAFEEVRVFFARTLKAP